MCGGPLHAYARRMSVVKIKTVLLPNKFANLWE